MAEEDFYRRVRSSVEIGRLFGERGPSPINGHIARETVFDEENGRMHEPLSDETRDTLIRHGRQDAAHGLLNTITIINQLRSIRRLLWLAIWLLVYQIAAPHVPNAARIWDAVGRLNFL